MKTKSFLLFLALFFLCRCFKDIKDERDGYVGRYDYTFTANGQDQWGSYSDSGSGTLFVTKGQSNEVVFKDDDLLYVGFMWENGMFTIPEDILDVDGDAYELTGEGQFLGDILSLTLKMEATGFNDTYVVQISGNKQ